MVDETNEPVLRKIFDQALELPEAKRQAYLESACGDDPMLLREVQKLLALRAETTRGIWNTTEVQGERNRGPAHSLEAGAVLGSYTIVAPLGKGGMGEVYLASRQRDFHAQVAIKISKYASASLTESFREEMQALAQLSHPNICRILDGGTLPQDGRPYIVMEYVQGRLLHEYCDRLELDYAAKAELLLQACQAVKACHERGIIHRDLTPRNVMTTEEGVVKVMDFGVATIRPGEQQVGSDLPRSSDNARPVGVTIPYASPEQVDPEGAKPVDERSDVYMFGTLMYRTLCGQAPFDGVPRDEQVQAICEREPIAPRRIRSSLPIDLDTVCKKCLEKDPDRRYSSMELVAEDLARFLRNEPVKARRAGFIEQAWRWSQRKPGLALLSFVLAVVATVGGFSTLMAMQRALAFQTASQQFLGSLAGALAESHFLNPSPYTFEEDFRETLSTQLADNARETIDHIPEKVGTRALLAAMHLTRAVERANALDKGTADQHFQNSLRLWRGACHDEPTNPQFGRFFAITLAFYTNFKEQGVEAASKLDDNTLLKGFSYQDPVDCQIAKSVVVLWGQRIQAFLSIRDFNGVQDAFNGASAILNELLERAPLRRDLVGLMAEHELYLGSAFEDLRDNVAAAMPKYTASRQRLLNVQESAPLTLQEMNVLADSTWRLAKCEMRHASFEIGFVMYREAIELGKKAIELSGGSTKAYGFLADTQWNCVETMRPTVSTHDRQWIIQACKEHLSQMIRLNNSTWADAGRLGACQCMVATEFTTDPMERERLLQKASHNTQLAEDHNPEHANAWRYWNAKANMALASQVSETEKLERREYLELARDKARLVVDSDPHLKESLQILSASTQALVDLDREP